MLEKSCKKFMLFREANELQQWINEKESALTNEEVGSDLEQVEVLQKKFDDFQKVTPSRSSCSESSHHSRVSCYMSLVLTFLCLQDLKANESRLRDINKVASELESEGLMAEEAPMVQAQVSSPCLDPLHEPSSMLDLLINGDPFFSLQQQEMLGSALGKVVLLSSASCTLPDL